jgi:hypothetical protein
MMASEMERAHQIGNRWMAPAELLDWPIQALLKPAREWPTNVRRLYVITLPVAFPLRWLAVGLLIAVFLILGAIGCTATAINCLWLGIRNPWQ